MQWGASDETGAWSSFFELVRPFIPSTGSVCGNLDVVLTRPGSLEECFSTRSVWISRTHRFGEDPPRHLSDALVMRTCRRTRPHDFASGTNFDLPLREDDNFLTTSREV
jgi:hypothetical protein